MFKKRIKDTDYLFISARLRAMERNLLTSARMDRMIDAPTAEDAAKVLGEIGYGDFTLASEQSLNSALTAEREKVLRDLVPMVPDKSVLDVFRVKYDYHNVKTMLKALATGSDPSRLLMDAGRVPVKTLEDGLREGNYTVLPDTLRIAAREAAEVLDATGDPQRSDFILDRAYYQEMLALADATGSEFLTEYVRASIDSVNLRSLVRTLRMKKADDLLKKVLFPGGTISVEKVLDAAENTKLEDLYRSTPLRAAAEASTMTRLEKACDDAVTAVVARAKRVPFGVEAVIAYVVAKEIEFTAVRIILTGRMAGLSGETIRERLRETYV